MKILSIHINGFGKLVDFNYNFDLNINEVIENNGFGKTSMMEFIRAMLFGLDKKKKNGKEEDKRSLYTPWNSNAYGGSMVIMIKDRKYRIERTFGSKQTDDTFALYDVSTNLISNDYTSDIGRELFGFDSESFKKSIYLPEQSIDYTFDDNLEGRLATLVSGLPNQEELNNIDLKIKEIDNELSNYKKTNKENYYKEYIERNKEIEEILKNLNIDEVKSNEYQHIIDMHNEEIRLLNEKLSNVNFKIRDCQNIAETNSKLDRLEDFNNEIEELNNNQEEIIYNLHNIVPTENDINKYSSLNNEIKILKLKTFKKPNEAKEVKASDKDIEHYKELINSNSNVTITSVKKPWFLPAIIISILVTIFAVVSIFTIDKIFGIISMVLGLFAVLLCIVFKINNNTSVTSGNDSINKMIDKFFEENDINTNGNYQASMNELIIKKDNYKRYLNELEEYQKEIVINNKEIQAKETELERLLSRYQISYQSNDEVIEYLRNQIANLEHIKKQISAKVSNRNDYITENKLEGLSKKENTIDFNNLEEERLSITNQIQEINNDISIKQNFIDNYKQRLDDSLDYIDELEYIKEEMAKLDNKKIVIEKYHEYIKKAIDGLKAKYVLPVRNNIKKYLDSLESIIGDFDLDIKFNFYGKEATGSKELFYYSLGTKQLIGLSLRLALLDSLFDSDKPFVILDDAFVNFDQLHLDAVKIVLNELSKTYQVLYFTCHKSRSIK